jgi:hypothetical protein
MGAFFPPECRNPLLALTCMGNFLHCRFTEVPVFSGALIPSHRTCKLSMALVY